MGKIILYYKSKCGSTKKYAEYISSKLNCEMKDVSLASDEEINEFETIIYGGGVYAGAIVGSNFFNSHEEILQNKKLIVFAVGLTEYDEYNSPDSLFRKNIPQSLLKGVFLFNFFGSLDIKKLKFVEKMLVRSMVNNINQKAAYLKTPTDEIVVKSWKRGIDLIDFNSCDDLLDCALNED